MRRLLALLFLAIVVSFALVRASAMTLAKAVFSTIIRFESTQTDLSSEHFAEIEKLMQNMRQHGMCRLEVAVLQLSSDDIKYETSRTDKISLSQFQQLRLRSIRVELLRQGIPSSRLYYPSSNMTSENNQIPGDAVLIEVMGVPASIPCPK